MLEYAMGSSGGTPGSTFRRHHRFLSGRAPRKNAGTSWKIIGHLLYRHHACGQISRVDLRCAHCGQPMHAGTLQTVRGAGYRFTAPP